MAKSTVKSVEKSFVAKQASFKYTLKKYIKERTINSYVVSTLWKPDRYKFKILY